MSGCLGLEGKRALVTGGTKGVGQAYLVSIGPIYTERRIDQTGAPRRRQHISARDQPPLAALGRSVDAKPDPLQHPGPGGHFAAGEQPALHAEEIRDCFAKVR
jgi:hypothetical protein